LFDTHRYGPRAAAWKALLLQFARWSLSEVLRISYRHLRVSPYPAGLLPAPRAGQRYVLYLHVPFCHELCPYCFFTRYPFSEGRARRYFELLRAEMRLAAGLGYRFDSLYIGGGTPTILIDELLATIDLAGDLFGVRDVSVETNPNHLSAEVAGKLVGRANRLSVGVQTFDDGLLRQVRRYEKYGSGSQILQHLRWAAGQFPTVNADMIFNLPGQSEAMLRRDLALVEASGVNQTTFHPLIESPLTEQALAPAVGRVDYRREADFYHIVGEALGESFHPASAWTFSRNGGGAQDEYIIDYPEYVGLGTGSFSYLGGALYVNVFSLNDYQQALSQGRMSVGMRHPLSRRDQMRYRFMTDLYGLRLDPRRFEADFGVPVARGLWKEMAFLRAAGAFAAADSAQLTLTEPGRYLMTVMMREFFRCVNMIRRQGHGAPGRADVTPQPAPLPQTAKRG
jgi:coproporphyrinogen III oxidase-like Fe-S oxidoreductase